jgi:ribosome biogenesis GTPase / thiamine phosphate phosphatase
MNLKVLGWNNYFEKEFVPFAGSEYVPGRIFEGQKHSYRVLTEKGEVIAEVSGKFRFGAVGQQDFPAVGDWVVLAVREDERRATIHKILQRKSKFSRKTAGITTEEQVLAANIDTLFLVTALNNDFNIRRIERYLIIAWESGANPVIVLSKADLCEDVEDKLTQVESVAIGVPVHVVSTIEKFGVKELDRYLFEGNTAALLGSSGVGKSTLINYILGEEIQKVQGLRNDDRGRHTSTFREMFLLPQGGMLIDTPGMRELQLWNGSEGISEAFEDIEAVSMNCRFSDCKHLKEPGCAVKEAIRNGEIDEKRYENYLKLKKELEYIEKKQKTLDKLIENKKSQVTSKYKNGVR